MVWDTKAGWHFWAVAACLCGLGGAPAQQTLEQAKAVQYDFRQNLTLYYVLVRGDTEIFGHLDAAGNFIADRKWPPYRRGQPLTSIPPSTLLNLPTKLPHEPVYEYRSGRLVPGNLDDDGNFLPDLGAKVTDFQDYRPVPGARRIYNLPGRFVEKGKKEPPPPKLTPTPRADPPAKTGVPAEYDYQSFTAIARLSPAPSNAVPWVAHVRDVQMELGHLNDQGDFVPDYGLPPFPLTMPAKPAGEKVTHKPALWYYNLPVEGADRESTYEYRSGRLLKGILLKNGTFVPDLDSRVLDFKEYVPGEKSLRTYNLPGRLKKKPPAPPALGPETSKKPAPPG
jgi:hypothetical protein